jgi:hypothetical protein
LQKEKGDALFLPIGPGRECRIGTPDDELVVVSQWSVREVVKLCDLKHAPVRGDPSACAPNVPCVIPCAPRQKEEPSAHEEVDSGASRGLPPHIARLDGGGPDTPS